tara:strand:+ start:23 stop:349 length:327 start_codon:yes stop_codon:yes gene_type:complete
MSEFNYTTSIIEDSISTDASLTDAWNALNSSHNDLIASNSSTTGKDFVDSDEVKNFFTEFNESLGKVLGAEEIKKQHEELYDFALMRPVHLSFGIMILSVLIYELYSN